MSQNTSSAVMQQRTEPHDSLDFFPTPPWATRALCEWLSDSYDLDRCSAYDPACGEGDMVRPLAEYFESVEGADVHDYGYGYPVRDFLFLPFNNYSWIIINPPFRLASQFVERALPKAGSGVAMLVRTAFLEGQDRYETLFSVHRPTDILQFSERVPMHKGKLTATGSTATAYCWIVWRRGYGGTRFHWIAPCRKRLERDGDYERSIK